MVELSDLSKEELLNLIDEYDDYILELDRNDDDFPISIYDFFYQKYRFNEDDCTYENDKIQNIAYIEDMRDTFFNS